MKCITYVKYFLVLHRQACMYVCMYAWEFLRFYGFVSAVLDVGEKGGGVNILIEVWMGGWTWGE